MYREPALDTKLVYTAFNFALTAIDARTGEVRWEHRLSSGGRCSMLVRDERLFVCAGGRIEALDATSGTLLWVRVLPVDMDKKERLELLGDSLLCSVENLLYALAAEDGAVRWSTRAPVWTTQR